MNIDESIAKTKKDVQDSIKRLESIQKERHQLNELEFLHNEIVGDLYHKIFKLKVYLVFLAFTCFGSVGYMLIDIFSR
jgi:hypothetical protein